MPGAVLSLPLASYLALSSYGRRDKSNSSGRFSSGGGQPSPSCCISLARPDKGLGLSTCHFLCVKSIFSKVYLPDIAGSANFIRVNYFDECS